MARFVVQHKVPLDFLGEGWGESYLTFRSVSLREAEGLQERARSAQDDPKKSLDLMKSEILDRFIEGKAKDEKGTLADVTSDDLFDLPVEVFVRVFQRLSGTPNENL